mmetsp:Transcript_1909/g.11692  ORF Transcript_1909/g.11692 Transcript_1909/m.11692 type:complete len:511 (+) Transcript_1909:6327-7859(+)
MPSRRSAPRPTLASTVRSQASVATKCTTKFHRQPRGGKRVGAPCTREETNEHGRTTLGRSTCTCQGNAHEWMAEPHAVGGCVEAMRTESMPTPTDGRTDGVGMDAPDTRTSMDGRSMEEWTDGTWTNRVQTWSIHADPGIVVAVPSQWTSSSVSISNTTAATRNQPRRARGRRASPDARLDVRNRARGAVRVAPSTCDASDQVLTTTGGRCRTCASTTPLHPHVARHTRGEDRTWTAGKTLPAIDLRRRVCDGRRSTRCVARVAMVRATRIEPSVVLEPAGFVLRRAAFTCEEEGGVGWSSTEDAAAQNHEGAAQRSAACLPTQRMGGGPGHRHLRERTAVPESHRKVQEVPPPTRRRFVGTCHRLVRRSQGSTCARKEDLSFVREVCGGGVRHRHRQLPGTRAKSGSAQATRMVRRSQEVGSSNRVPRWSHQQRKDLSRLGSHEKSGIRSLLRTVEALGHGSLRHVQPKGYLLRPGHRTRKKTSAVCQTRLLHHRNGQRQQASGRGCDR